MANTTTVGKTLEFRFDDGAAARGNVWASAGTLSNVSAVSGYVRTRDRTPLAFVILNNHYTAESGAVRSAQDAIALARFSE